jgi:hypothetical protein
VLPFGNGAARTLLHSGDVPAAVSGFFREKTHWHARCFAGCQRFWQILSHLEDATMKSLAFACAVLVAGLVGSASANEVSKSTLGAMGFGNATIMSDVDGLAVRGKGTSAAVWGEGTANYTNHNGSNTSTNGYDAAASHRKSSSLAKGSNLSYAGNAKGSISDHGTYIRFNANFAGGKSSAFAR